MFTSVPSHCWMGDSKYIRPIKPQPLIPRFYFITITGGESKTEPATQVHMENSY